MAPRRYERLADAGAATGVIDPLLVRAYLRAGHGAAGARAGRRHAAQRRGAAPVRGRRGAARREGRRREPVPVADARRTASARRATGSARCSRWSIGWSSGGSQAKATRARRAAGIGRAPHPRGDVGGDEARRQLGVRLPRRRRRPDALRRRARRERGDAPRAARCSTLMCRELARARRDAARGRHRRRLLRGARVVDARPTSAAWSPRSRRCCRRWSSSSSTAATPRCSRTSRRTTRCSRYDGTLVLRGVAFRSSRAEPFGEAFLRRALDRLLAGDVAGVRDAYLATVARAAPPRAARPTTCRRACGSPSRRRSISKRATAAASCLRSACSPSGRTTWSVGRAGPRLSHRDRARRPGRPIRTTARRRDADRARLRRRALRARARDTFAARLARAFTPEDFAAVFADPDQPSLFASALGAVRPVLTTMATD